MLNESEEVQLCYIETYDLMSFMCSNAVTYFCVTIKP